MSKSVSRHMLALKICQLATSVAVLLLLQMITSQMLPVARAQDTSEATLAALKALYTRPETIPFPAENPYSIEKATLGKMLFFDQRLSGAKNMSCASCHTPSYGWEVPFDKPFGGNNVQMTRHAQTVLNLAWGQSFSWDGRAATLEAQARGPVTNPGVMNLDLEEMLKRLQDIPGYVSAFAVAFPEGGLTIDNVFKAIATYERTIVSAAAPFDIWVEGDDEAISDAAKRGFVLFNGKAECSACHMGWNFTDEQFHDIGLSDEVDRGRINVEPDNEATMFAFKTPGLRNILQRAPFMHDGSLMSLEDVIGHYASGGNGRETQSHLIRQISLSEAEQADVIAFLAALTPEQERVPLPILPN